MINNILRIIFFTLWIPSTGAAAPRISLNLQDGVYGGIEALDPTISWSGSTSLENVDISYGASARAIPTRNLSDLSKEIWAKISTKLVGDIGLSLKARVEDMDFSTVALDLGMKSSKLDSAIYTGGNLDSNLGLSLDEVQFVKDFRGDGHFVSIKPTVHLKKKDISIKAQYSDKNGIDVEIKASKDIKSVTVSSQVDDRNRISPTLTSKGDISIDWERRLGGDDSVITSYKPDKFINILLKEGPYKTKIFLPIDGVVNISGAEVTIKRDLSF